MKTINLLFKVLFLSAILLNFGCKTEEKKGATASTESLKNNKTACDTCDDNPDGTIERLGENDLSLKFNSNFKKYQMIHVDLLEDFILLAEPTIINNDSLQLKTKLAEIKRCEKFSLVGSEYIRECPDKDSIPTHHLKLTLKRLKKGENNTRNERTSISTVFKFNEGDAFDVHIFYEGEDNSSVMKRIPDENCQIEKPVSDDRICRAILSKPNN